LKNKNKRRRRGEKRGQFNHEEADHVRWLGLFFSLRQTYGGGGEQQKEETTKEIGAKKCCTVATVVALDQFRETGTPLFPPLRLSSGLFVCLFVFDYLVAVCYSIYNRRYGIYIFHFR
jgi:hypothetical protein